MSSRCPFVFVTKGMTNERVTPPVGRDTRKNPYRITELECGIAIQKGVIDAANACVEGAGC
jgi:hypothetical protein